MTTPKLTGFPVGFDPSQEPLPIAVGRLYLRHGIVARLILVPDDAEGPGGLVIGLDQSAEERGALLLGDTLLQFGKPLGTYQADK